MGRGGAVPRYYFHFSDGKRQFSDNAGLELRGMAEARKTAARQVRELKLAVCHPNVQDLSAWSMTVVDSRHKPVFSVGFEAAVSREKA